MAGKSTILRSVCAVALLSACGLYAPVQSAVVPYTDAFMLRNFSADSPLEGKSSFAVEMVEMRWGACFTASLISRHHDDLDLCHLVARPECLSVRVSVPLVVCLIVVLSVCQSVIQSVSLSSLHDQVKRSTGCIEHCQWRSATSQLWFQARC